MYPCSPALKIMIERTLAQTRSADPAPVERATFRRHVQRALNELHRPRPRIVEFAPQIALERALHLANTIARQ